MLNTVLKHIASFLIIFTGLILPSEAQLYFNKACISNPNDINQGSQPGQTLASCDEPTYFIETSNSLFGNWNWDLGDGTVRNSIDRNLYHSYTQPGTYTVKVQAMASDNQTILFTDSKTIVAGYYPIQPRFNKEIESDTTICSGGSITLDPYKLIGSISNPPSGMTFKWFPNGETSSTLDVNEPGCYSVEVTDPATGCSRSAKINVKVCYEEPESSGGSEKWYFGHGSSLEFSLTGNIAEPDSTSDDGSIFPEELIEDPAYVGQASPATNPLKADEAAAVVLNAGGKVVLYSDGKKIYSGDDDSEIGLIGGGDFALNHDVGAQGVALVPKPICGACDFINYYLFTANETTGLLSYSVIDMRENDKKGAIDPNWMDIPVAVDVTGKIAIERSSDDKSYILTFYNGRVNDFRTIIIDSVGLINPITPRGPKDGSISSEGYVTISTDGSLLAHGQVISGENVVKIFTRDAFTGELTEKETINLNITASPTIYGLAFSPNGQRLYVSLNGGGHTDSKLIQIDLEDNSNSIEEIYSSNQEFGALALGPKYGDGSKFIYLSIKNSSMLHYIQAPNEVGKNAVGFTLNSNIDGVQVGGSVQLGFPNVASPAQEGDGNGLSAQYFGSCMNAPTVFTIEKICDPFENEVTWTVEGKTYKGQQVEHTFSKPGWHDVILKIDVYKLPPDIVGGIAGMLIDELLKYHCTTVVDTGKIYIKPAPFVDVPDPLYVCTDIGFFTKYEPNPTGGQSFEYRWMTGAGVPIQPPEDALPYFEFKTADPVQVEITNNFRCQSLYKFNVKKGCEPIIELPTVMTPNGDRLNDDLKVVYNFIEDYRLEIYNRWGKMVFATDNFDIKWDGKVNGQVYPNQLYAYIVRYFARDFPERKAQKKVGSILVLTD